MTRAPFSLQDPPGEEDLMALESLAVAVAVEAGTLITDQRPVDLGVAATKSSDTDVVTVMDRAAETLIRQRLHQARPDDAVLGEEEGGGGPAKSGITWVVDPIDGTVNYLYDLPDYAVSIAAAVGDPSTPGTWVPVAGAVVSPRRGEVYRARRGGGSYLVAGDRRIRLGGSGAADIAHALVGTGFGYAVQRRAWQGDIVRAVLPRVRDIRRMGSAAIDLCQVASGRFDAFWEVGLNPWDLAAGWLICTEAGIVAGGPQAGEDPQTALTLMAAPGIAVPFADLVRSSIRAAAPLPPES
ncbi:MAG: inositol monophosphatase family protein [Nostocoides sp.]